MIFFFLIIIRTQIFFITCWRTIIRNFFTVLLVIYRHFLLNLVVLMIVFITDINISSIITIILAWKHLLSIVIIHHSQFFQSAVVATVKLE